MVFQKKIILGYFFFSLGGLLYNIIVFNLYFVQDFKINMLNNFKDIMIDYINQKRFYFLEVIKFQDTVLRVRYLFFFDGL